MAAPKTAYGPVFYHEMQLWANMGYFVFYCNPKGSDGGFMTNWIIGHTDRFCCTASQRSISNWLSFYVVSDIGQRFGEDQYGGNSLDDTERLWQQSPPKYAKNVHTPTLFIHSDEDYSRPLEQGCRCTPR